MTPVFKYRKCPKCYGWGKVKGKRKPTITCPKCRGRCEVLVLYNGKKVKEGTEVNQQFTALVNDVATAAKMDDAKDAQIAVLQKQIDSFKNVSVFDGLELTAWTVAKGTLANSGQAGSSSVASQNQPSTEVAWLGINPQGAWANSYFYKKLGADPSKSVYKYEMSLMFADQAASNASNCIELDIQQVISGVVFNPGLQWNFSQNTLRVWDRSTATPLETGKGNWTDIGKPCPRWTPKQWMRFVFEAHRDEGNVYMDALTVNGVRLSLGMNFSSPSLGLSDGLNCAIQLDGNKVGTAYKLYIDAVKFTASKGA